MKTALEQHLSREARIIHIIVGYCPWQEYPFATLQCLLMPIISPGRKSEVVPIAKIESAKKRDKIVYEVACAIKKSIEQLKYL